MNYKMLLPSYRTRFRQLLSTLKSLRDDGLIDGKGSFLNLGCGEGDFDRHILDHFSQGFGCDINEGDVRHCRDSADGLALEYTTSDAHRLPYEDNRFDCVICIDVIEHTARPEAVIRESQRVLKPGGYAIFSYPRLRFPFFYDPINFLLRPSGRHLPIGAYSYGHDKLIDDAQFSFWIRAAGYVVVSCRQLSGEIVGASECYWPGIAQKVLKQNANNQTGGDTGKTGLRPTGGIPKLVWLTDFLINADRRLAGRLPGSIGIFFLLRKERHG
jgi:ubiquinone/menaquinone biosynthesis C-methylase UbiE